LSITKVMVSGASIFVHEVQFTITRPSWESTNCNQSWESRPVMKELNFPNNVLVTSNFTFEY